MAEKQKKIEIKDAAGGKQEAIEQALKQIEKPMAKVLSCVLAMHLIYRLRLSLQDR